MYLQGYVKGLDRIARWITRDPDSRFVLFYELLTEPEAKGDASLLGPRLRKDIPVLVERWGIWFYLLEFVKLTFGRVRWKERTPDEIEADKIKREREKKSHVSQQQPPAGPA